VTGGTGFVARWCIVELLERGYRVRTMVRDLAKQQLTRKAVSAVVKADDRHPSGQSALGAYGKFWMLPQSG
jgi:uncharacterized protein YbjT (DUF2867 family)